MPDYESLTQGQKDWYNKSLYVLFTRAKLSLTEKYIIRRAIKTIKENKKEAHHIVETL
ncbi:ABC-type transport system involved in resistance to organic solvents auxiliary component [Wolbachia endosymbiont of Onchocerca ochengi]|uniref:hypothetical protein n=1 Tax=Wolbachia endosymbiont of Onchocerca ochengi TaxID=100901 RepID=UPI00026DA81F|nr:hypothetical protein [Wolbachia endosymbiont of Onchocerca ochengi]CCF78466.1 ABC-type transport system involved in resistance to organic solvents auxiliary component [Wolbachia endosymbiont of Onchocerca ochengi]